MNLDRCLLDCNVSRHGYVNFVFMCVYLFLKFQLLILRYIEETRHARCFERFCNWMKVCNKQMPTYLVFRTLSVNVPGVSHAECQRIWCLARWVPTYLKSSRGLSPGETIWLSVGLSCRQTCSWGPPIRHATIGYIIVAVVYGMVKVLLSISTF